MLEDRVPCVVCIMLSSIMESLTCSWLRESEQPVPDWVTRLLLQAVDVVEP